MTEDKNSVTVDVEVSLPRDLKETTEAYLKALQKIDKLYNMQLGGRIAGAITKAEENRAWNEIIQILTDCTHTLPEQSKSAFEESLQVLKGGIYDLYPLKIASADESPGGIELILGKVFLTSGGGESYYSGAAGVCNREFDHLIKYYDAHMPLFTERLGSISRTQEIKTPDEIPELRCLDIFSLSGGLDIEHKPICVFFSGGARENVSSLSNMTVFINLYQSRFKAVTEKIAERYIVGASDLLGGLTKEDTARLLLTWLRGHDVGHFFGADNLGSVMSEFDMDYMILHELKSDFNSLYSLRNLDRAHFNGCSIDHAYMVAMSEMLRYIRRGGIYKHPDSGSAYLTYMALKDKGALAYDETSGTLSFDIVRLEEAVEECTVTLLELFSKGDASDARAYVNSWGELADTDKRGVPKSCPEELRTIISDNDIVHNISYVFKWS
jgi:hypothetical protein